MRNTGGHPFFNYKEKMKPSTTITAQIKLLKMRGLYFNDVDTARAILLQNNYYRLTGYWRKYQIDPDNDDDRFKDNVTFESIVEIYRIDTALRNLLLRGIEIFEICFRSVFAYYVAHSVPNGSTAYLEQNSYTNNVSKNELPEDLLAKINGDLQRSTEKYVDHFKQLGQPLPIWVAVEVLSFGNISKMFSRWADKTVTKKVNQEFKIFKNYDEAIPTIRALVNLRNVCAHQARIWNKKLTAKIMNKRYLQKFGASAGRSPWKVISALMLLVDEINQNNTYSEEVLRLCRQNPEFYDGLINPTL